MSDFDWDGSKEKDRLRAAYEEDVEGLWTLVDFWSARLTNAIDRLETSRRRLSILGMIFGFGIALGLTTGAPLEALGLRNAIGENLPFNTATIIIIILATLFAGAMTIFVLVNEVQNLTAQRREVADTYFVFKDLQQIFVATLDKHPSDFRHRVFADARGRVMMMSYLERKALRYIHSPHLKAASNSAKKA
ncbi:hypothetical protein LVY75_21145 [Sinorhizobium sp. B11]